ncbi:glutamate--tRNA ligase [Haloferula sp. A504]|uniref:glutamate--tRNA ligase n=1 Tax=Haloferula sp. A504 TaxID=3373601 RepID=UPI0031C271AA|nr:glutamate--tRNA ligase [Verrucomicrobiaceae bacterium E54]
MHVRTRFAPSPTGFLHVGGARTALFNFLFARHHGGSFVLRVEDTDKERNTGDARAAIFDGMRWLGLDWDEGEGKGGDYGPYNQSERTHLYDKWFEVLLEKDRVYEDDGAWRFRFERKPVTMNDLVCGEVTIDYRNLDNNPDMVVRRSDGSYVFHFVNVVDDLEMKMTHVIRGEDHLMNTPKHLQLFEAFGVEPPQYAHMPLTLNADGSKMSKRDEGAIIGDYPKAGFIAPAVANFIALLGWNPKTEEEVFTMDELIERFSLENINRSPGRFDSEKCAWINQQHLLKLDPAAFAEAARPFVETASLPITDRYPAAAASVQEKVRLLSEVPEALDFLLKDDIGIDGQALEKVRKSEAAGTLLAALADALESLDRWSADAAKECIGTTAKANGAKPGQLMFPTRVALSGKTGGPDLGDILGILGKQECVKRLRDFVERRL